MSDRVRDVTDKAQKPGAAASDLSSVDILKEQPSLQAQATLLQGFPQCVFHGRGFSTVSLLEGKPPEKQVLTLLKRAIVPLSVKSF